VEDMTKGVSALTAKTVGFIAVILGFNLSYFSMHVDAYTAPAMTIITFTWQ
jgi:hypothetical protein